MRYSPERYVPQSDPGFTQNDPCVWVVYPPGAAGDLIAAIIDRHYIRTSSEFRGITDRGQIYYVDAEGKQFNIHGKIDHSLIDNANQVRLRQHIPYNHISQTIFSNHGYTKQTVDQIVEFFPKAKVVRITPRTPMEWSVMRWLEQWKNKGQLTDFRLENFDNRGLIDHPRVLDIAFGDVFGQDKFEKSYKKIQQHLDFEYALIRYDFVQYWLDRQHPYIQPYLQQLSS